MGVQLRTRVAWALVVATGVWTSAACGPTPSKTGAALPPVTLTALSYNAPGRPPGDQLEEFAKRVEAADVGVTLRILPAPDSGLPDTSVAVIDQVRTDGVDVGVVSSRSFDTLGVNAFRVIQAPLLARSNAAADAVLDSAGVPGMLNALDELGLTGIGLAFDIFGYPVGFGSPLLGPDTWVGKTISARPSAITKDTVRRLGAEADPVNGADVVDAIVAGRVNGTFDSLAGPTSPADGGIITVNVPMYFRANVFVLNTKAWEGLAPQQQQALRSAADDVKEWTKARHVDDLTASSEYCLNKGDVVIATRADLAALEKATEPIYDELRADPATADALTAALEAVAGIPAGPAPQPCVRPRGDGTVADSHDDLDVVEAVGDQHRLDGVWRWTVDYDDMISRGATKEDAANNKGTWTLTIDGGRFTYTEPLGRSCSGDLSLDDERMTLVGDGPVPCDAYMDAWWNRDGDSLVLQSGPGLGGEYEVFFDAFWADPLVRIGDPP
jgi:TRAP-type C4-dicarboxylate transport system substrate-binding protein